MIGDDAFPCPDGHDCPWCRPLRIAGWWQPALAAILFVGFLGGIWLLFPAGLWGPR